MNSVLKPSKYVFIVRQDRALLLYVLVKGFELNVGKIVEESILDYEQGKFSGNIPHLSLFTLLCIKEGVKFNKAEEERCLKASPLILARVRKALVKSEKGERREKTRKRKRARTVEDPREPSPITLPEEEANSEEIKDFEAYAEQPVLSPTVDQGESTQIRVE